MRVFFTNLGCKLNQAEVEGLARRFLAAGHRVVGRLEEADLHVVNSCTVTHAAARDSRKVARRGRRLAPGLKTVLTGCYAAAEPQEAARLTGVDLVVANADKERLLERVHQAFPGLQPPPAAELPVPYVPLELGHARAMVKIGDGCNMRCAFCIIPATRGRERYRAPGEVVAEVRALAAGGSREVVVTGVQISSYRHGGHRLADLVAALLAGTGGTRLRLTSIAPWDLDERLLALFADRRLCRHLHLSLQSGSTPTLRRMRRPYSAAAFARVVEEVRRRIPGVAVTTDVIVGFPGESEDEFAESLAFVRDLAFTRTHVFPYSPRPGTAAAELPGHLPHEVKARRMQAMLAAAAAGERRFRQSQLGETLEVLWEGPGGEAGSWRGLSDNYVRVIARAAGERRNTLGPARLVALGKGGVLGEIPAAG
jgi:threonylcarbamoyladenosine tRNA methylthiotransferase MtaB